jgi:hypothetical protein
MKPFPLYDDILFLVDGTVATGAGAFHAGGSQALSDIFSQSQTNSTQTPGMEEDDGTSSFLGDTSLDVCLIIASSTAPPLTQYSDTRGYGFRSRFRGILARRCPIDQS